jgi:alkylhydroperoxidase/carboxymuconolactone decarboxylase family protein YurZ
MVVIPQPRTFPGKDLYNAKRGMTMANESKDTPVLDTLSDITTAALEHSTLDPPTLMLTRIAALVAIDAPPASYLLNAGVANEVGVTAEQIQQVFIAVAPVVGTARIVAAAGNVARALGFAIAVMDSDFDLAETSS